jgi:hypothetical protein
MMACFFYLIKLAVTSIMPLHEVHTTEFHSLMCRLVGIYVEFS